MIVKTMILFVVSAALAGILDVSPVFGFSAFSALITFVLFLPMEMKRFSIVHPYFTGRDSLSLDQFLLGFLALSNSATRALIVGAAALFTFPSPELFAVFDADYAKQLERDEMWTYYIMGGTVLVGMTVSLIIDGSTDGRGHRWSLFRLAAVYGLIVSASAFTVQKVTGQTDAPAFVAPRGEVVLKAISDATRIGVISCESIALKAPDRKDGVRRPHWNQVVERGLWKANGCGAKLTPHLCESLVQPEGGFATYSFDRSTWRDHGCAGGKNDVSFAQLMSVVTVLDDFVDQSIVNAADGVMGQGRPFSEIISALLAIFVSSNLIQGVVVSTYVTLFLVLTRRRRAKVETEE